MFSGTVLVALAWLAGNVPSAVAHPREQPEAILRAHTTPIERQRDTTSPCPCEPSEFEDDELSSFDEDAHRCAQAWPVDCVLTCAISEPALSSWRDALRGEPLAAGLPFAASLGLARGPPARC